MDTHSDNIQKAVDEACKAILTYAVGKGCTEAARLVALRFGFEVSEKTDLELLAQDLGVDL